MPACLPVLLEHTLLVRDSLGNHHRSLVVVHLSWGDLLLLHVLLLRRLLHVLLPVLRLLLHGGTAESASHQHIPRRDIVLLMSHIIRTVSHQTTQEYTTKKYVRNKIK